MVVQKRVGGLLVFVALVGGACRNNTPAITYDSTTLPTTTTQPPATTESADVEAPASSSATAAAAGEAWVDVTGESHRDGVLLRKPQLRLRPPVPRPGAGRRRWARALLE